MKTIKNLTLLMGLCAVILLAAGCDKTDDTGNTSGTNPIEEPKPAEKSIIGKWKLVGIVDTQTGKLTDSSKENIIFDFQENSKLIVIGRMPSVLDVFDDFQEGEHFYEYLNLEVCPTCLPGANLFIDKPQLGQEDGRYYCLVDLDNKTMEIGGGKVIGGVIDDAGLATGGDIIGVRLLLNK